MYDRTIIELSAALSLNNIDLPLSTAAIGIINHNKNDGSGDNGSIHISSDEHQMQDISSSVTVEEFAEFEKQIALLSARVEILEGGSVELNSTIAKFKLPSPLLPSLMRTVDNIHGCTRPILIKTLETLRDKVISLENGKKCKLPGILPHAQAVTNIDDCMHTEIQYHSSSGFQVV